MQHLDEGTIHTWLDGQLPRDEAAAVEAHVAECRQCADAVAEARGLIAASSRILTALDVVPRDVVPKPSPAISHQPSAGASSPAAAEAPAVPTVRVQPTVQSAAKRAQRRWFRGPSLAAAATIVVAVGTFALMRAGGEKIASSPVAADVAAERAAGPAVQDSSSVVYSAPVPAPVTTSAPAVANEARDARADGERRALADAAPSAASSDAPRRVSEPPVAGSQSAQLARQELQKQAATADQTTSARERDEAQARSRPASPPPPASIAVAPRAPAPETARVQIFRGAKAEVKEARPDVSGERAAKVAADLAAATGSIRGRVKDANGTGIEGALVSVVGTPAGVTASRSGEFELGGIPAGAQRLVGRHVGFAPDSKTVAVRAGEATTVDITLAPIATGAAQNFAIARAQPAPAGQAASVPNATAASIAPTTAYGCYTLGITPGSSQTRTDYRQVPRRIALDSTVVPARPDGIWYQVRDLGRGGAANGVWRPTPPDGIEVQWIYGTKTATLRLTGVSGTVLRGSVEEIDRVSAVGDAAAVVAAKSRCDGR